MSSLSHSKFVQIPVELLISVLAACDSISLARCKCVCKRLYETITDTTSLQLVIELHLTGQEVVNDGATSSGDVLNMLRRYTAAWDSLNYTELNTIPMLGGDLWELYGGVLALSDQFQKMKFYRLPSPSKGIDFKEWILGDFGFPIRDFGMDPAQDLLVLVQAPSFSVSSDNTHKLHLRTLSTGKPHPLTSGPILFQSQGAPGLGASYNIQVSGAFVGILVEPEAMGENKLCIWEWKTGKLETIFIGDDIQSFVFYSERMIIMAVHSLSEPDGIEIDVAMLLANFITQPPKEHRIWECKGALLLTLPSLHHSTEFLMLNIRADPAPDWAPSTHSQTPFFTARKNRIYALSLLVHRDGEPQAFVLLIPRPSIDLCIMEADPETLCIFRWEVWGPAGTRHIGPNVSTDPTWVCYVNGTKFVNLRQTASQQVEIEVFDLNPLKDNLPQCYHDHGGKDSPITRSRKNNKTVTAAGSVFIEDVVTTLPCSVRTVSIPDLTWNEGLTAICSEDSILVVDSDRESFRVLSF